MYNMAIISSLRFPIFPLKNPLPPKETEICRMTLAREPGFMTRHTARTIYPSKNNNNILKKGIKINIVSTVQQSSVYDETLVTVEQNHQLQEKVQRIKEMILNKSLKSYHVEVLVMIDAIQRLGLQYYFQNEIGGALRRYYERCCTEEGNPDLHDTALAFRLLRQHGYNVSADCFSKFKDTDGNFKQELEKDSKGLMSLYEAFQMRIPGDHILNNAGEFSAYLLQKMKNTEPSKSSIIVNTLSHPYHKILPRFMALDFLQNFESSIESLHNLSDESNWIKEMQYLAAIDINMAQINHQSEITQVSRWWKGLRLTEELKLARNQPAKWHMWSLACLPGADMAEQRVELTKAISFIYIIDDIFDVYGTLDELILFTEAVNRWEYDNVTELPNYMRVCLKNLYELINEINDRIHDKHGWSPKEFLQKVWKDLFNAYLVEAKWLASGHTPSTDEYLKNGIVSVGVGIACAHVFLLLGEGGNKGGKCLLNSDIEIVSLTAAIFRLRNDLGSGKDGNPNGYDGSYVACYMNEHKGKSAESACEHVHTMISDAWTCLNETCQSSPFPAQFKEATLNLARMVTVMYDCNESHQLPSLDKHTKSLLISEQTTVS